MEHLPQVIFGLLFFLVVIRILINKNRVNNLMSHHIELSNLTTTQKPLPLDETAIPIE